MDNAGKVHEKRQSTVDASTHSQPAAGIKSEGGVARKAEHESKPSGSLSAARNPLTYFGRCIAHLFARIADIGYVKITTTVRQTKRTLEDPFATQAQKNEAYNNLLKVFQERHSDWDVHCTYVSKQVIEMVEKLEANNPQKASELASIFAQSPILSGSKDRQEFAEKLMDVIIREGDINHLREFLRGIDRDFFPNYCNEGPNREALLGLLDKFVDKLQTEQVPPLTNEQKILIAQKILYFSYLGSSERGVNIQRSAVHALLALTRTEEKPFSTELLRVMYTNDPSISQAHRDRVSFAFAALKDEDGSFKLSIDEKAELVCDLASINEKGPSGYKGDNQLWSGTKPAQFLIHTVFEGIDKEDEAAASNAFAKLIKGCTPSRISVFKNAAIEMLRDESANITHAQKKHLAETIASKALNINQAIELLKTGLLEKETSISLVRSLCTSCYKKGTTELNVDPRTIQNIIERYVDVSPQLSEAERKALLEGSILPLIKRAEARGKAPASMSLGNIEGRKQLAQDLASIAKEISTQPKGSTEVKALETLLHLATHEGPSRILSHTHDLTFHLEFARNANQSKATQQEAANKAANQLKSIERESRGGDGLIKYVEAQKAPVQRVAEAFLEANADLSARLRNLIDASSAPKKFDYGALDALLGANYDDVEDE